MTRKGISHRVHRDETAKLTFFTIVHWAATAEHSNTALDIEAYATRSKSNEVGGLPPTFGPLEGGRYKSSKGTQAVLGFDSGTGTYKL